MAMVIGTATHSTLCSFHTTLGAVPRRDSTSHLMAFLGSYRGIFSHSKFPCKPHVDVFEEPTILGTPADRVFKVPSGLRRCRPIVLTGRFENRLAGFVGLVSFRFV